MTESVSPRSLVVVVDPQEDFCTILGTLLEAEGFEALGTTDPDHALDLVRERRPAAMVGEHPLPVRDGRPLCSVLLDDPTTASIPFIAVTARAFADDLKSARGTHLHGVFTKPVRPRRIVEHIRDLLGKG